MARKGRPNKDETFPKKKPKTSRSTGQEEGATSELPPLETLPKRYRRTRTGYVCPLHRIGLCYQKIRRAGDMRRHLSTHYPELRRHLCVYCAMRFYQKHSRDRHTRCHTRATLKCKYPNCSYENIDDSQMHNHQVRQHNYRPSRRNRVQLADQSLTDDETENTDSEDHDMAPPLRNPQPDSRSGRCSCCHGEDEISDEGPPVAGPSTASRSISSSPEILLHMERQVFRSSMGSIGSMGSSGASSSASTRSSVPTSVSSVGPSTWNSSMSESEQSSGSHSEIGDWLDASPGSSRSPSMSYQEPPSQLYGPSFAGPSRYRPYTSNIVSPPVSEEWARLRMSNSPRLPSFTQGRSRVARGRALDAPTNYSLGTLPPTGGDRRLPVPPSVEYRLRHGRPSVRSPEPVSSMWCPVPLPSTHGPENPAWAVHHDTLGIRTREARGPGNVYTPLPSLTRQIPTPPPLPYGTWRSTSSSFSSLAQSVGYPNGYSFPMPLPPLRVPSPTSRYRVDLSPPSSAPSRGVQDHDAGFASRNHLHVATSATPSLSPSLPSSPELGFETGTHHDQGDAAANTSLSLPVPREPTPTPPSQSSPSSSLPSPSSSSHSLGPRVIMLTPMDPPVYSGEYTFVPCTGQETASGNAEQRVPSFQRRKGPQGPAIGYEMCWQLEQEPHV